MKPNPSANEQATPAAVSATKPAHTPTPWQVIEREETPECCDFSVKVYDLHSIAADSFLGTVTSKTDAALIVRAVNSHAELCEKLEQFVRYTNNTTDSALALFNREARAALAKAQA